MTIVVSRLTWDMAQWEIHALRNELHAVMQRMEIHAMDDHPDSKQMVDDVFDSKDTMDADMLGALRDATKRAVLRR